MKLNGIDLVSYATRGDEATFVLGTDDMGAALAAATDPLVIEAGGSEEARFEGYAAAGVERSGRRVVLRCVRKLEDATADAIRALEANVATAKAAAKEAGDAAAVATLALADLGETAGTVANAAAELGVMTATSMESVAELGGTVAALEARIAALEAAQA